MFIVSRSVDVGCDGCRVVKIYLDNRESFSKDNIYYSSVNKKYFLQKMKEWHVELEDNKPEEIPPWKEQI